MDVLVLLVAMTLALGTAVAAARGVLSAVFYLMVNGPVPVARQRRRLTRRPSHP